jgi:hypothetical protein
MNLVTITDHDSIDGALAIAHRNDVIVGNEVTTIFPEDKTECHIGVLGMQVSWGHLCKVERRVCANAIEGVPLPGLVRLELKTPASETRNIVTSHASGPVDAARPGLGMIDDETPLLFEEARLTGKPVHVCVV